MLQVDRRNQFRAGQGKASVDFISRNKKAIRQTARSLKQNEATRKPPQPQRSKVKAPAVKEKDDASKTANSANTVVISKQYLDELLRMSVMGDDVRGDGVKGDGVKAEDVRVVTHVNLEPSQVPGLGDTADIPKQVKPVPPVNDTPTNRQEPPPSYQATPHSNQGKQQWLNDLAVQAREQRARRESERLRQRGRSPEDYFPFGRPGGGAPIRNQAGHVITNYQTRGGGDSHASMVINSIAMATTRNDVSHLNTSMLSPPQNVNVSPANFPPAATNQISPNHISNTPRFARGAGPFVDQYILQEKEEKRKKQMEHMAFIQEQVAAKERAKMEERLRQEKEEALEELRLAKERERMRLDYEREREKARLKELEALKHQALLQSRIAEAEESARRAKQDARAKHNTVSFNTRDNWSNSTSHDVRGSYSQATESPRHLLPAKFNSNLRSPSMLQLPAESADLSPRHQPSRRSHDSNETAGKPAKQRRVQGDGDEPVGTSRRDDGARREGGRREGGRKGSRIPVLSNGGRKVKERSSEVKEKSEVRRSRVVRKRSPSPPVPALARKMNHPPQPHTMINHNNTMINPPLKERSRSPPVPALARKLNQRKSHDFQATPPPRSPPVPALAKKMGVSTNSNDDITITSYRAPPPKSPPVPALAKRLATEHAQYRPADMAVLPSSPPVPALANRRLNVETDGSCDNKTDDVIPNSYDVIDQTSPSSDSQIPINRVPSCSLIVAPDPSPHTPTITMATDDHGPRLVPTSSRQHLILQELASLREGILSQRSTMDDRVKKILTRKKCTF